MLRTVLTIITGARHCDLAVCHCHRHIGAHCLAELTLGAFYFYYVVAIYRDSYAGRDSDGGLPILDIIAHVLVDVTQHFATDLLCGGCLIGHHTL